MLIIAILLTGIVMTMTGLLLYTGQASLSVRFVHHQLSILFTIILGLMGFTGFYLFLFPYLR